MDDINCIGLANARTTVLEINPIEEFSSVSKLQSYDEKALIMVGSDV